MMRVNSLIRTSLTPYPATGKINLKTVPSGEVFISILALLFLFLAIPAVCTHFILVYADGVKHVMQVLVF